MRTPLAIVGPVMLLSGCMASYPVRPDEAVTPTTSVTITFDSPRDLEAKSDATAYALPAIRKVHGRVEAVRSDTLVLRVLALESGSRQPELPDDARLAIPRDASSQLATRRISSGRSAAATLGVMVLGILVVGLATMDFEYDCTGC